MKQDTLHLNKGKCWELRQQTSYSGCGCGSMWRRRDTCVAMQWAACKQSSKNCCDWPAQGFSRRREKPSRNHAWCRSLARLYIMCMRCQQPAKWMDVIIALPWKPHFNIIYPARARGKIYMCMQRYVYIRDVSRLKCLIVINRIVSWIN